jgi:4-amino-4-deoxy-L-arabinose transferase-like glycosyltransferase
MKNFLKKNWLLILIIVLAFILRFWKLDIYPALNADEASNSYDAYSLIQTGKDQHGHSWPIAFQSFNDYKPGLYVYLGIPFVRLMGLTPLAARLPGAIAGVLSVFVLYLLVKELFDNQYFIFRHSLPTIASLFLAISPWHIQFSRGGWEVNVATFLMLLGFYLLIKFINSKSLLSLVFGIFSLALSLYCYHAARVIVPLLGITLLIIYRKEIFIKENTKKILIGIGFGIIILIPLIRDLLLPGALSRAAGVGLFADKGPVSRINEQRGEHGDLGSLPAKLVHNKVVNYTLAFLNNWTTHYNGEFLFMSGDSIQRNKVPETGEMYLFDIIFLIFGFIYVVKYWNKSWVFIISWLLIAPLASSLTFQSPNALRSQNMVIPLIIVSAFGFVYIVEMVRKINNKYLLITGCLLLAIIMIWNFSRYQYMYWKYMDKLYPYSSQYGVKELVDYVYKDQNKYSNIFITNRYDQPYILFLFYMKYPPQDFQFHHTLTTRDEYGFSTVADFDKYHFGSIDFDSLKNNYPGSLIIGTPEEIANTANIIKRIYGTNGFEYFDVVQN